MEKPDNVLSYGTVLGWNLLPRTVLVEGTSDVFYFELAAFMERKKTGVELLGTELAIIAAGEGDRGGTRGVIRELVALRGISRTVLLQNGSPKYRFIGLFDNDTAGREAVEFARKLDTSILEYKDVFRLQPTMVTSGNLDPKTLNKTFERDNSAYKGLDWELEDVLPLDFRETFFSDHPEAAIRNNKISDKVHHDLTRDGKARLKKFVNDNAVYDDLKGFIDVLKAIRFYMCLPTF
ncbi:MAG: hypothetical protein HGB11_14370 [Chlorobiales bacterium]|nr:hypothetical protein [Chlorobiales bacterium]